MWLGLEANAHESCAVENLSAAAGLSFELLCQLRLHGVDQVLTQQAKVPVKTLRPEAHGANDTAQLSESALARAKLEVLLRARFNGPAQQAKGVRGGGEGGEEEGRICAAADSRRCRRAG